MWPHHFNMSYNLNLISTLDLSRPLLKCLTFSYTARANWPKSWFPGGEYSEMIQPLPKYPWLLRFVSSPRIEQLNSSVVSHSGDQGPGALGPWGPGVLPCPASEARLLRFTSFGGVTLPLKFKKSSPTEPRGEGLGKLGWQKILVCWWTSK